jgi:hypothetical protein
MFRFAGTAGALSAVARGADPFLGGGLTNSLGLPLGHNATVTVGCASPARATGARASAPTAGR